jgi:thiopurine S-methyltransferase
LCGKSLDLVWLADRGYHVVGVDLSEVAAKAFAAENKQHTDRIEYRVGDFFDVTPESIGKFDLIYDRAALIALPPNLRPKYAEKLQSLLAPSGRILLISLEYDPQQMQGPPFEVPESEIRTLFKGHPPPPLPKTNPKTPPRGPCL